MIWLNPVSLQFNCEVVSEKNVDAYLRELVLNILRKISCLIEDVDKVNDKMIRTTFVHYYKNVSSADSKRTQHLVSLLSAYKYDEIEELLLSEKIDGLLISGDETNFRKLYESKPTSWSRSIYSVLGRQHEMGYYRENAGLISELLNCYDENPNNYALPENMLKGTSMFTVSYISSYIDNPTEYTLDDSDIKTENKFHHRIQVQIPCPMLKGIGDMAKVQDYFVKCISDIASKYKYIKASVDVDIPHDFSWCDTLRHVRSSNNLTYCFSKYITGYPWCMLLGSSQAGLLTLESRKQLTKLYEKVYWAENGNLICQLTKNVDSLDGDTCAKARDLFRAYLPSRVVGTFWRRAPISVRMGCRADEYLFDENSICCYTVLT